MPERNWLERIAANLPGKKPQLWENLPRVLRRRLEYAVLSRLSRRWFADPHQVSLSGHDLTMEVVPQDVMGRAIYFYGILEVPATKLVEALLDPGMVFVDVGANAGYYTLLAARLVGPTGQVHAFEPVPAIRDRLVRNVALNGLLNVVVHPEAVWSESGEIPFFISASAENSGLSSALPGGGRQPTSEPVAAIALGDFAALERRPDLVKIDVEGGEPAVLQGARSLLASPSGPALLFETFDLRPQAELLAGLGYTVRSLDYSLAEGLEFPEAGTPTRFSAYEAPNYVALKDGGQFAALAERSRRRRSWMSRLYRVAAASR